MSEKKEPTCSDCQYFRQHYSLNEGRLFRIYCGHCVFWSRAKTKRPDAAACENFISGAADAEAFVTKEYLSKALLHRVLNLPLLPEIAEDFEYAKGKNGKK